jgi:hypothetical protein
MQPWLAFWPSSFTVGGIIPIGGGGVCVADVRHLMNGAAAVDAHAVGAPQMPAGKPPILLIITNSPEGFRSRLLELFSPVAPATADALAIGENIHALFHFIDQQAVLRAGVLVFSREVFT